MGCGACSSEEGEEERRRFRGFGRGADCPAFVELRAPSRQGYPDNMIIKHIEV